MDNHKLISKRRKDVLFKCKKDFVMYNELKTFTKNKYYKGNESHFCWIFINDQNNKHHLAPRHIEEYFKEMGKE